MATAQGTEEVRRVRWPRWLLCLAGFALLRCLFFSASFPFFSNLDEVAHVDTVLKYASGNFPHTDYHFYEDETQRLFLLWDSPQFRTEKAALDRVEGLLPPGLFPEELRERHIAAHLDAKVINHEAYEQPGYYVVAALWLKAGRLVGIEGIYSLYWLRFLSALVYCALVLLSYGLVRKLCPDRPFLQMGLPLLLAVFPQDVYYCISTDVPGHLLTMLCLWQLLDFQQDPGLASRRCLVAGLSVGLAFVIKPMVLPVVGLAFALVFLQKREPDDSRAKIFNRKNALLVAGMALPVAIWVSYTLIRMGRLTVYGEKAAMAYEGWNSFEAILQHPLFSISGVWTFFADLIPRFWRGEIYWHAVPMRHLGMDYLYLGATLLFLPCSLLGWRQRQQSAPLYLSCWYLLLAATAMLIVFSLAWEFGNIAFPSRGYPYMNSGRLIAWLMVPFCLLFLDGMESFANLVRRPKLAPIGLILLVVSILISELLLQLEVLKSPFNLFHLLA